MRQSIGLNLSGLQKFNDFFNAYASTNADRHAVLQNLSQVLTLSVSTGEPYYYTMENTNTGRDETLELNRQDVSIVSIS